MLIIMKDLKIIYILQFQQVRNKWANWLMIRDVKRRRMSAENFLERTRINAMRKNDILPVEIRELADKDINKFEMNAIPLRINNRCVVTSRYLFNSLQTSHPKINDDKDQYLSIYNKS